MKFVVSIAGYGGAGSLPVSLECFYDKQTDVLVLNGARSFTDTRPEGFALITNLEVQTRDFLFTNEMLREAIRDFFTRFGQDMIHIDDSIARFSPQNEIQLNAIDERGPKYELSQGIGNGQVAVLAAIAFVSGQSAVNDAVNAMDEFAQLYEIREV